jgi:hypothetical protein
MTELFRSIFQAETMTENDALSLETSQSGRVDFFFKLTRDVTKNPKFEKWLIASWEESPLDTMKLLFNSRDCRGGKGDRDPFMIGIKYISNNYPEWFIANFKQIPTYGRWLDLIELYGVLENRDHKMLIVNYIVEKLREDYDNMGMGDFVSLLAKWIPSEKKHYDRKTNINEEISKQLFEVNTVTSFIRRRYRKEYISPLREYIQLCERYMCANKWDDIIYSNVPSVAMKRYRKAFAKHSAERFQQWIDDVKNKKQKINASQVYPHELVRTYLNSIRYVFSFSNKDDVIEEQWKAIIEKTKTLGTFSNSLAICDVSGSMEGVPMEVSIALGILVSSCSIEPFNDILITFSEQPTFIDLSSSNTLIEKVHKVSKMNWGMNTDFEKVFKMILEKAKSHKLAQDVMPKTLYVFSDMQFDEADNNTRTNFENIKQLYANSGYTMPQLVFWNLRSDTTQDMPVTFNEKGVALLSGYSPALLKSVLSSDDLTPYTIMRKTIDDERYDSIISPLK